MATSIDKNRIQFVNAFLNHLNNLRPRIGNRSSNIFEIYCYSLKLLEFMERGFLLIPEQTNGNQFLAHLNPGDPANASYFRLRQVNGPDFNLFINCKFQGASYVLHCPDIVLQNDTNSRAHSIYECKNYSNTLPLSIYREFIGYLKEMRLPMRGQKYIYDYNPELRPSIYTSASAGQARPLMLRQYDFDVVDHL